MKESFGSLVVQFSERDCHFVVEIFDIEQRRKNNQVQPSHTEERSREIFNAVDGKSKKFNKKMIVSQQGMNISWHRTFFSSQFHFFLFRIHVWLSSLSVSLIDKIQNCASVETIFDLGKRLSFVFESAIKISCHPLHPIYPLRQWVLEWERTSIRRECLLELYLWQNR